MESPMEQVENIKMYTLVRSFIVLCCTKDSKCLWYNFVPKNQRWNRSEPLAKKNEAAKSKGVVGNPGITMPIEPHIKQRKAKVK